MAIDLRSDLLVPRTHKVAEAMRLAVLKPPAMETGEDPDERALTETIAAELGVEAALLVPTCTMANQIAIRLHLPEGGVLAAGARTHIVTVEARATALTGVTQKLLPEQGGHPTPDSVAQALADRPEGAALVWLENTHMLSAGSVLPAGWLERIAATCRASRSALHIDGSRLWNAAVAQNVPLAALASGCDTVALSLNKAIGAPYGAVLAGSQAAIRTAADLRDAMSGQWRPIGPVAAAAYAALEGWRDRLETDTEITHALAAAIVDRLGPEAVLAAPTNLIFLKRPGKDARRFVEALGERGVRTTPIGQDAVRLAIHSGVREAQIEPIVSAVSAASKDAAEKR